MAVKAAQIAPVSTPPAGPVQPVLSSPGKALPPLEAAGAPMRDPLSQTSDPPRNVLLELLSTKAATSPHALPSPTTVAAVEPVTIPTELQTVIAQCQSRRFTVQSRNALITSTLALPDQLVQAHPAASRAVRDAVAKALERDPALKADFVNALSKRVASPIRLVGATEDLGADILAQVDRTTGHPLAASIKLRVLTQMEQALTSDLADTPWAWNERSHQLMMVGRAVVNGKAHLTAAATRKLEQDLAALKQARSHDGNEARALANAWVSYLLKPETTLALRGATPGAQAEMLVPALRAINSLHKRLATIGEALEARAELGAALRLTAAQAIHTPARPTYPQLATLFTVPATSADREGADQSRNLLEATELKNTVTTLAKANWGYGALTTSLLGLTEAFELLVTPEMSRAEITALDKLFNRTKSVVEKAGYHSTHPDGLLAMPLKRFAATLAAVNTLYAFSEYKAARIGGAELGMRVGFYTSEILEWAAATGYGHKLVAVPLEKGLTETAARLLSNSKLATELGAAGAKSLIPVMSCLLAAGATYFEYDRAVAEGDSAEARARLTETIGWGALGVGTAVKATATAVGVATAQSGAATSATGVGLPIGITLMVVGGVLVVGATCYDFFVAPNEMEKLAEKLGYAHR